MVEDAICLLFRAWVEPTALTELQLTASFNSPSNLSNLTWPTLNPSPAVIRKLDQQFVHTWTAAGIISVPAAS